MPARQRYSRETFSALYDAIAQKLLEQNPPIKILKEDGSQDTVQLGINWQGPRREPNQHHAASVIAATLENAGMRLANEKLNFGSALYSKFLELKRDPNKKEVVVQGKEYNEGLVRYLGFRTLQAFEESISQKRLQDAEPEPKSPAPPPAEGTPYTYYIGAFYSFRSYRVNKFVLAIRHSDLPTQPMDCWQWGFHTTERLDTPDQLPGRVNSVRFDGKAVVSGRHLYINLYAAASDNAPAMQMHLVGICDEVGGDNLHHQDAIPCALQTVSLDQYTVSIETYLLRCTEEDAKRLMESPAAYYDHNIPAIALQKKPSREKSLQLYLMLQRRNFRVKFKPNASNLDGLEYRGNLVGKYTERLSGEYRIWNFGLRRGVVIQSKLVISTEVPYRTFFYPYLDEEFKRNNPGLEEQLAVLAISNEIRKDQLCFATFVKRGLTLVNYAIFDIRNLRDDNWVEGMFVTTGYDHRGIVGGYAVMCKVKPGESCEPQYMKREEAEEYAHTLGLTGMHEGLRKLWKRKLWKQKSNTDFGCYAVVTSPEKSILMVRKDSGPYKGLFELPGGRLLHGEAPEDGLRRCVAEETGVNIGNCSLWVNDSITSIWKRPDQVEEKLHHIGALYLVESKDIQIGQLDPQAFWIKQAQYNDNAFSPFALKALKTWGA